MQDMQRQEWQEIGKFAPSVVRCPTPPARSWCRHVVSLIYRMYVCVCVSGDLEARSAVAAASDG